VPGFLTRFLKRWARIQVQTRVPLELLAGVNLDSHRARLGIGNIFISFASGSIRGRLRLLLWYLDVATPTKRKKSCRCFNLRSDGSAQRTSSTDVGKFEPGHGLVLCMPSILQSCRKPRCPDEGTCRFCQSRLLTSSRWPHKSRILSHQLRSTIPVDWDAGLRWSAPRPLTDAQIGDSFM
jgi:hypothetical protein